MKNWYQIKAQAEGEAEILLYGEIGFFGILAIDLIKEVKALGSPKKLTVRVNSPGGQWIQGLALYNFFAHYAGEITFLIDGIAASIASVVVMAGKVIMPENSFLMIHDIMGFADGTPDEIREQADIFDKLKLSIVQAYAAKSKLSEEKILEMMENETWLSAQEAKDLGFADEISAPVQLAALANPESFKHPPAALKAAPAVDPEAIRAQATAHANRQAREIYDLCAKAGIADAAPELLERGLTVDQVKARLADAGAIRSICVAAGMPQIGYGWIKAGVPLEACRSKLFEMSFALQGPEIDNKHLGIIGSGETKTVLNPAEIYASRKRGLTNGAGK